MAAIQRILLWEDDAALGNGIRLALQSPEVQIVLCRTLAQAQPAVALDKYDLLILDENLPDGSGLALLEQVRQTSNLPVILLTANDMEMDVVAGLESAVSQLAPRAAEKSIRITLKPTDTGAVFDPKWTEEAIYNLLDNAVKYTPAGGAVRVTATAYPMFSAVHVRDTGAGIPEEEQPKVFQRFYRSPEHAEEEGVGIGLYLVRQIAEGQGGYVKVSSRPGAGSTFSLYLPEKRNLAKLLDC